MAGRRDREVPGEGLARRLERRALRRIQVGEEGEAYTGPAASRALQALGARAMTVDRSVVVDEGFDPSRPEDRALYAHERVHVERGGTSATHAVHDAEELAARAEEAMVLHELRSAEEDAPAPAPSVAPPAEAPPSTSGGPSGGLAAWQSRGLSRQEVVQQLARRVLDALDRQAIERAERGGDLGRSIE